MLILVFMFDFGLAYAEDVERSVGGSSFNFTVPAQFCVLNESNGRDAQFIDVIKKLLQYAQNKLILLTADCDRLKAYRLGEISNITRYALYYIPDDYENNTLSGGDQELRKELCQDMRKQGDATLSGVKEIVGKAAKDLTQT